MSNVKIALSSFGNHQQNLCSLVFLSSSPRIRPIPLHPVHNQQYVMKPKYYHVHSTHTQSHGQPQPDHPIPLSAGHNGLLGESAPRTTSELLCWKTMWNIWKTE